jgi:tetratricopeptide (TPR) repeat protein
MIEWCRRLRHQGWHAGFLRKDRGERDLDSLLEGLAPRLVVVDYAETRLGVVEPLLLKMGLASDSGGPKLRVLLLARRLVDWWNSLSRSDRVIEDLLLNSPEPQPITAMVPANLVERRQAFDAAVAGFALQLDRKIPDDLPIPNLTRTEFDRVLYLHMAALAALQGGRIETAEHALDQTLSHERQFWQGQVRNLGLDRSQEGLLYNALGTAVAAVTLAGGTADLAQTRALLGRALKALSLPSHHFATIQGLLRDLYQSSLAEGGYLEAMRPDLLGEEWVAHTLKQDERLLADVLEGASPQECYSILTLLDRLARRRPDLECWLDVALHDRLGQLGTIALDVAVDTGDPIGVVLAKELETSGTGELMAHIYELQSRERYQFSVPLREVALVVTRGTLAHRKAPCKNPTLEQGEEIAVLNNNLGIALRDLGRSEESLTPLLEAVEIHRRLAEHNSEAFLHHLPLTLGNLGEVLSDLRRPEEALACTLEAVELYRRLVRERGELFQASLALNLGNLGGRFADVGKSREALAATQEAAAIFLRMQILPSSHLALGLVKILKNLANRLSDLVGDRRRLKQQKPQSRSVEDSPSVEQIFLNPN